MHLLLKVEITAEVQMTCIYRRHPAFTAHFLQAVHKCGKTVSNDHRYDQSGMALHIQAI